MSDYLDELVEELVSYRYRPRDFAYWAWPWGEEGELETLSGPEPWQDYMLGYLQERCQDFMRGIYMPVRIGVRSGHGIGKSGFLGWASHWAMTTAEDTRGVLTAGTETQLKTKTWVEMAKWNRLFIASELFSLTATALFPKEKGPTKEWRLDIIPWSENNPAAFAGLHNLGKRLFLAADEGSEIPTIIHETMAGAETDRDTEIIRILFGNPTEPEGYFRDIFEGGKFAGGWHTKKVDSRDVSFTNKEHINREIQLYGEDSDYVKVRFKGEFPSQSGDSFISGALVEGAAKRALPPHNHSELVMGVDIGRKNDPTVLTYRRGLDARSIPQVAFTPSDASPMTPTLQILQFIMQGIALNDPGTLFIDIGYIGAAIYDLLLAKRLTRPVIFPVDFGAGAEGGGEDESAARYANKRAEIWGRMRVWLVRGCIAEHDTLRRELTAPTYKFHRETTLILESKEQLKNRLEGRSTDYADSLATTFAQTVDVPMQFPHGSLRHARAPWAQPTPEYHPFSEENIYGSIH